jgi:hypothetical protein
MQTRTFNAALFAGIATAFTLAFVQLAMPAAQFAVQVA